MLTNNIISAIYPELLVLVALLLAILLTTTKFKNIIWISSTSFLLAACIHIFQNFAKYNEPVLILNRLLISDSFSNVFKLLVLSISILVILGSVKYSEGFIHKSEFMIILLSAVLGIMFLISANDLITLFVALETLGLSSIMLIGYAKYDTRSNEASVKYLLNTASASARKFRTRQGDISREFK